MPVMDTLNIGWLEEPFPAHDHHHYAQARGYGRTPLAAGENHFTRFEATGVAGDRGGSGRGFPEGASAHRGARLRV